MKKIKIMLLAILCLCLIGGTTGCALMDDAINDIKGDPMTTTVKRS